LIWIKAMPVDFVIRRRESRIRQVRPDIQSTMNNRAPTSVNERCGSALSAA